MTDVSTPLLAEELDDKSSPANAANSSPSPASAASSAASTATDASKDETKSGDASALLLKKANERGELKGWDIIRRPVRLRMSHARFGGGRSNDNVVYINLTIMDLEVAHGAHANIDFVLFTVFRDDFLVKELKDDDAGDLDPANSATAHHKTYETSTFSPQFFGTSHMECIHGSTRSCFHIHHDEETNRDWVQNTARYNGVLNMPMKYGDFPFDAQTAKMGISSFAHAADKGQIVFKFAPNMLDLQMYGFSFADKDDCCTEDWPLAERLPHFGSVDVSMEESSTWQLLRDECMATDNADEVRRHRARARGGGWLGRNAAGVWGIRGGVGNSSASGRGDGRHPCVCVCARARAYGWVSVRVCEGRSCCVCVLCARTVAFYYID